MGEHQRCDAIVRVENIVCGNGTPGLSGLVAAHEVFIQRIKGACILISFLGVTNLIALAAILIKIYSNGG